MKNIFNKVGRYMDSDRAELHGCVVAMVVVGLLLLFLVYNIFYIAYGSNAF